ncbi:MAG: endonuclease [Muricauda sp.]|nr:endonuclease/exonuclease/phosphatase family protein [Allomuricauda sp.]MAU26089.1 endonuclease [Allomuricauda sp.]MBC30139.1 endonuclease [Allomuricauda sp.]
MRRLVVLFCFLSIYCHSQSEQPYRIRSIAFYNVENLFDTTNDTLIFDDERTPTGAYGWTQERYQRKIANISRVLSEIGKETTGTSPDIIGLCEVENKKVINDLVAHVNLRSKNYGIVHHDSPDERGIDVALLYKKNVFLPHSFNNHRLLLFDEDSNRDYSRDQLVVGGMLDNEEFHFIVNHWPSRSGGEAKSRPNRIQAAHLNKRIIDSILRLKPSAKIISMGDFNDDPRNDSFKKVLKTVGKKRLLDSTGLFNPMERLFKKGVGSLAYRDKWNLFDQFFFTANLLSDRRETYSFWKVGVFDPDYLKNKSGPYRGYPFRTYVGTTYHGGYADHFPVYLFLVKASPNPSKGGE